ncbi:MAG: NAD-dependent epimerase/dehydratase family protein [Alphaproteobacteria bacterium]|nr:NAD-dependent epimerase/dehydratase family protein [Alphaproteobacteria bacterium]
MIIIGGNGFLGRHLCRHLHELGRTATIVSRTSDREFLDNYAPEMRLMTAVDFASHLEREVASAQTLVHLASTSVPATYVRQPWLELTTNVAPAFEILARAVAVNPGIRLVFLSSGGTIYGTGHNSPIGEDMPAQPISPYGYGKLALEEAIRFLGRSASLNYAILRVSNPVGSFQMRPDQGIASVAWRAARSGEVLTLFNGGEQIRDFIDADDVARAIVAAADGKEYRAVTWNVGSGVGTRVTALLDLIESLSGLSIRRKLQPGRATDVSYSVLDCSRVLQDLGWQARIPLEESVHKLISDKTIGT